MQIFIISGKAQAGKDTTAKFIHDYYTKKNQKCINLQFSSYIKMYAKNICSWNGEEETKPRTFLQDLGQHIRNKINVDFFINRIIEDIKVYSKYYNIITISDTRLIREIEKIKETFPESISIHILRKTSNNLNEKETNHKTEIELDNYHNFNHIINNDKTLKDLENKIISLLN